MNQASTAQAPSYFRSSSSKIFKVIFPIAVLSAPLYIGAVHLWSFCASVFILAVVFFAYWIHLQSSRDAVVLDVGADVWMLLYGLFFILSASHTWIPYKTAVETFKTLSIFCVFYATVYYCRERSRLRLLATELLLWGGTLSIFGLLQYLGALPKDWWDTRYFLSSVYVNHNHFAGFLEIILPVSIGFLAVEKDNSKKALFIFLCVLMGAAFIFSLSRGGILALALSLLIMAGFLANRKVVRKGFWMLILVAILAAGVTAIFGVEPLMQRLATLEDIRSRTDLSAEQRLFVWRGTLDLIRHHFWLGTGPGTFANSFFSYRPLGFTARPGFAHNDYLQLLADGGVFTFIVTLAFFVSLFYHGLRILNREESPLKVGLACGCMTAILALSIHSFFDFNFHIPANWFYMTVVIGIFLSLTRTQSYPSAVIRRVVQVFVTGVCLAVILGSLFFGVSDFLLWRAKHENDRHRYEAAYDHLSQSLRVNPLNDEAYFLRALWLATLPKDYTGALRRVPDTAIIDDLRMAIRSNAYEPYYDLNLAKARLKVLKKGQLAEVLPDYANSIRKDPKDPQLYFQSGKDLLGANAMKDPKIEDQAKQWFKKCLEIDPAFTLKIYGALWDYEKDLERLKTFNHKSPTALAGFVSFLEDHDFWKIHRKYYLESLGIDPNLKYRLGTGVSWDQRSSDEYSLDQFGSTKTNKVHLNECFYANGRLEKMIYFRGQLCRIVLEVKGSRARNSYPNLLLWLDGKVVDSIYIDSPQYIHFYSAIQVKPGEHRLGIEFNNDYADGVLRQDRNVWIKKIELQYPEASS